MFFNESCGLFCFIDSIGFEVPFDLCEFTFVENFAGEEGMLYFFVEFHVVIGRGEVHQEFVDAMVDGMFFQKLEIGYF